MLRNARVPALNGQVGVFASHSIPCARCDEYLEKEFNEFDLRNMYAFDVSLYMSVNDWTENVGKRTNMVDIDGLRNSED